MLKANLHFYRIPSRILLLFFRRTLLLTIYYDLMKMHNRSQSDVNINHYNFAHNSTSRINIKTPIV